MLARAQLQAQPGSHASPAIRSSWILKRPAPNLNTRSFYLPRGHGLPHTRGSMPTGWHYTLYLRFNLLCAHLPLQVFAFSRAKIGSYPPWCDSPRSTMVDICLTPYARHGSPGSGRFQNCGLTVYVWAFFSSSPSLLVVGIYKYQKRDKWVSSVVVQALVNVQPRTPL